ncbi:MAG: hypothetical protein ACUVS1_04285 [Actinomycetota bacterium]
MAQLKATRRLDSPSIDGIQVNFHDVTELRSAERRLREMVRVFQALGPDVVANMETVIRGLKNILGRRWRLTAAWWRGGSQCSPPRRVNMASE